MNYRLLAIAKTQYGTFQYAVVETQSGSVEAILHCKDGYCHKVNFIDVTPTSVKWILNFIKQQEERGLL